MPTLGIEVLVAVCVCVREKVPCEHMALMTKMQEKHLACPGKAVM